MCAVDRRVVRLQQHRLAQLGQQYLVRTRPYAGLGPLPQPPPDRHPTEADRSAGAQPNAVSDRAM